MGQSMLNIVSRDYRTPSLKTFFIRYHVRLCQDPYCQIVRVFATNGAFACFVEGPSQTRRALVFNVI